MGVIAKGILRDCQGLFTPVSLGYPLSVFNKNSTLKERKKEPNPVRESRCCIRVHFLFMLSCCLLRTYVV